MQYSIIPAALPVLPDVMDDNDPNDEAAPPRPLPPAMSFNWSRPWAAREPESIAIAMALLVNTERLKIFIGFPPGVVIGFPFL